MSIHIVLLFINIFFNVYALKKTKPFSSRPYSLSRLSSLSSSDVPIYSGPVTNYENIEAGCTIDDLKLQVLVGKSTVCNGRGLFIAVDEDADEVTIPRGTAICGYSKGTFTTSANGTMTVAYIFEDIDVAVFFNKELIPLKKAIALVADKRDILKDAVKDHSLYYDDEQDEIIIIPNLENANNYFIPYNDKDENDKDWSIGRMGIYANDLAFTPNITEIEYNRSLRAKNLLQLVWRMDVKEDVLIPTWPVVIVNKDIKFLNKEPMEVGISYSYRYWKAAALTSSAVASSTNQ